MYELQGYPRDEGTLFFKKTCHDGNLQEKNYCLSLFPFLALLNSSTTPTPSPSCLPIISNTFSLFFLSLCPTSIPSTTLIPGHK